MDTRRLTDEEKLSTLDWLRERYEDSVAFARQTDGDIERGWLANADYYEDAIAKLDAEARLRSDAAELARILDSISARLPDAWTIEDMKAYAGYGYRLYDLKPPLKDGEIVKLREILSRPTVVELMKEKD